MAKTHKLGKNITSDQQFDFIIQQFSWNFVEIVVLYGFTKEHSIFSEGYHQGMIYEQNLNINKSIHQIKISDSLIDILLERTLNVKL